MLFFTDIFLAFYLYCLTTSRIICKDLSYFKVNVSNFSPLPCSSNLQASLVLPLFSSFRFNLFVILISCLNSYANFDIATVCYPSLSFPLIAFLLFTQIVTVLYLIALKFLLNFVRFFLLFCLHFYIIHFSFIIICIDLSKNSYPWQNCRRTKIKF